MQFFRFREKVLPLRKKIKMEIVKAKKAKKAKTAAKIFEEKVAKIKGYKSRCFTLPTNDNCYNNSGETSILAILKNVKSNRAEIHISDCEYKVTLQMNLYDKENFQKSLARADIFINEFTKLKEFLLSECERLEIEL
jgi:hypothetical protein